MGPWPLARFGAAANLLGRGEAAGMPLVAALGPELLRQTHVVLGSDLASVGIATELDPADADALERAARGVELTSGAKERKFLDERARSPRPIGLAALVHAKGVDYAIEHRITGPLADVATAREVPADATAEAAARLGPLAGNIDHVVEHWGSDGTRGARFGVVTTDRTAVAAVLARSNIAAAQQTYFADTAVIWTKWDPNMIVRVGVSGRGVLDEVALVFRNIPGEHLVRVWRTFRPRSDGAQRIGAFVGAMGADNADRLEIRMQASAEPVLEATFVPANTAFARG